MPRVRSLTEAQRKRNRVAEQQKRCSEMVRQLMARHHETQKDIAVVIGAARPTVSQKMNQHTPWEVSELLLIADHYKVDDLTRAAFLGGTRCSLEL